jgi:hypothetical protein
MTDPLRRYRLWFRAAAAYNVVWALVVTVFAEPLMETAGIAAGSAGVAFVQVMAMMVGVYAIGYYLMARDPIRYCGFIWIALAGKTLGPLGFLYYASTGVLPWTFGWTCVFNDIIWWPAFWRFALEHARRPA